MKKIIAILFLSVSLFGFSQKIKLKKGDVLVNDVVWLKYQDCGNSDSTCSLLNLNSEELIFMKFIQRSSEQQVFNSNGEQNYYEVSILGLNKKIEIREFTNDIIKIIYNSNVVNQDGTLNTEKVDRLVEKYGTPFSDRLKKTNNSNPTIIINNNQAPQRSGVNINIGR